MGHFVRGTLWPGAFGPGYFVHLSPMQSAYLVAEVRPLVAGSHAAPQVWCVDSDNIRLRLGWCTSDSLHRRRWEDGEEQEDSREMTTSRRYGDSDTNTGRRLSPSSTVVIAGVGRRTRTYFNSLFSKAACHVSTGDERVYKICFKISARYVRTILGFSCVRCTIKMQGRLVGLYRYNQQHIFQLLN